VHLSFLHHIAQTRTSHGYLFVFIAYIDDKVMILIGSSKAGHRELPTEILIKILGYLEPSGDVSADEHHLTLKNFSLACHFFRDLTLPQVCSALSAKECRPGPKDCGNSRLKQMLEDETTQKLASLVKDFRVYGSNDVKLHRKWMNLYIKGLSVMTSLQSVALYNICLHTELVDALTSLPSLQSLTLINCRTKRDSVQDVASPPSINVAETPVLVPLESSFRELKKVTVMHSDFALMKLRISPDNLQDIKYGYSGDWHPNSSILPYPASDLTQLQHLTVSVPRGVDLGVFFRDLSSMHRLTELVIQTAWLPDIHSLPQPGNRSQPILPELGSLACSVLFLQYFVGCPLRTLDLAPAYDATRTQFPPGANRLPIPPFPSLHALVILHHYLIKLALPLGEKFPQLHVLDLMFVADSNFFSTLEPPHECLVRLCDLSPLPHLETLVMRHPIDRKQFNLVEQRNWLDSPIKNTFPSLTRARFFLAVDWYWSHEEKNWAPFIPIDQRRYASYRDNEWVDPTGYLESILRPIINRQKELLLVRVPVPLRRPDLM
jgi:hypothetical protein